MKTDEEDEATLHGRLKRDFDEYRQYEDDIEIPETDENAFAAFLAKDCDNDIKKLIDKFAFLTRYCFSCLTDADSIDTAGNSLFSQDGKSRLFLVSAAGYNFLCRLDSLCRGVPWIRSHAGFAARPYVGRGQSEEDDKCTRHGKKGDG